MQTTPQISVVMAACNEEEHIASAVNSILAQTFEDFELIVVNDGSRDRTLEILQSYTDSRIKIISNSQNAGLPKSLNMGIAAARGRYIARQDSDDFSLPQRLEKQFNYFQENRHISMVGSAAKVLFGNGSSRTLVFPESLTFQSLLKGSQVVHGSAMMRKDVLEKIGGYNEIFRYAQDYELWLRIAKKFTMANLQEILYVYRMDGRPTKRLPKSTLYRLLARNLATSKESNNILREIQKKGITSYYDTLSNDDKIFYHDCMRKDYMKDRYFRDALDHHRRLAGLQGLNFKQFRYSLKIRTFLLARLKPRANLPIEKGKIKSTHG